MNGPIAFHTTVQDLCCFSALGTLEMQLTQISWLALFGLTDFYLLHGVMMSWLPAHSYHSIT